MYKKSLSAASLVVALPGAFLAYLLVMAFLQEPGFTNMAGFLQIVSGLALAMVTLMVLMPAIILIFGPKAAPSEAKTEGEAEETVEKEDDEMSMTEDAEDDFGDEGGEDMFADDEADDFGDEAFDDDDAFDDFDDDDEFK